MLTNSSLNFSMGDSPACNINRNKSIWESCGKENQCQVMILEGDLEVQAIRSGKWGKATKGVLGNGMGQSQASEKTKGCWWCRVV